MRRLIPILFCAAVALAAMAPAPAQPKPKDPVMHNEMVKQFAQLTNALGQISTRLAAIEEELARLKTLETEVRNAQQVIRATDDKVRDLSDKTRGDLVNLQSGVTQLRNDVLNLTRDIGRNLSAPQPAAPASSAVLPEGYIIAVDENQTEVTINLGSGSGVKEGMRFAVFPANDPKNQIGTIAIKMVLDAGNSRCEVTFSKPGSKFSFSDIVRPL
jgi:prefoldin subunit 5